MNTLKGLSGFVIFAFVILAADCLADVNALSSLPQCIVEYTQIQNEVEVTRIVLYKTDSTFVELSVISDVVNELNSSASSAPHAGSYAYTVDPLNPSHATISYSNVTGSLANDDLYFMTNYDGRLTASLVTAPENSSHFTLYPRHINDSGAMAFSTRCALSAGGTATSGIAIAPGEPRWMVFRAVGASLTGFGVSGTSSHPSFTLYDSSQSVVGNSSVWSLDPNLVNGYNVVFDMIGEFPLSSGSDEGVLLILLKPGTYTAVFTATGAGQVLCEAYLLPY